MFRSVHPWTANSPRDYPDEPAKPPEVEFEYVLKLMKALGMTGTGMTIKNNKELPKEAPGGLPWNYYVALLEFAKALDSKERPSTTVDPEGWLSVKYPDLP